MQLKRTLGLTSALVLTASLTACGSDSGGGSGGFGDCKVTSKANSISLKPVASGTLTVETTLPAQGWWNGTTPESIKSGYEYCMAANLANMAGLDSVTVKNVSFDQLVAGRTNDFDLALAEISITPEREKVVDFATYFQAGTDLMVPAGNPKKLATDNDSLCGLTVAAEKGTIQYDDIVARSKKCTDAGKKAISAKAYPDQNQVNLNLATGRIDAALADSGVAGYMAEKSSNKFEIVGSPYETAPYGIAIPKNNGDFAKAIQGAIQKIIDNGTYATILKKWAAEGGAITTSEINAAKS